MNLAKIYSCVVIALLSMACSELPDSVEHTPSPVISGESEPIVESSNGGALAASQYFAFSKVIQSDDNIPKYIARFGENTYLLTESTTTGLLIYADSQSQLPGDLEYKLQLSFLLSESENSTSRIDQIYSVLNFHYPELGALKSFIRTSKMICFGKKDNVCLESLIDWLDSYKSGYEGFPEIEFYQTVEKGSIYLLLAKLTNSWAAQREFLELSLRASPENKETIYLSQLFSIEVGLQILSYYENETKTNGFNTALSFSTAKDGKFNFGDAVIESVANTYNLGRLITSRYLGDTYIDDILTRQSEVVAEIRQIKIALMELKTGLINLTDFGTSTEFIIDKLDDRLLEKPFFKNLITVGLFPQNAAEYEALGSSGVKKFEIENIDEFTNPKLSQILVEQVNILNFLMLFRGPAMVQAFGKTKLGILAVEKLKLRPMVDALQKLRWPLNSLLVWLALETADGCLIRYAYVFYHVGDQIAEDSFEDITELLNSAPTENWKDVEAI